MRNILVLKKKYTKMLFLKYGILAVIIISSAIFACYKITEAPPTWYDEGMVVQLAINLANYGKMGTQVAPGECISGGLTSTGFTVIYPIALIFKLTGIGLLQARIVMVVYIVCFLIATFVYLYRTGARRAAIIGGLLIATFPPLYANGKNILGEVPGVLFLVLLMLVLNQLEHNNFRGKKIFALAGLFAGLCIATKPVFILLMPALVVTWLLVYKRVPRKIYAIKMFCVGFFPPLIIWACTQFSLGDNFGLLFDFYRNPYQITNVPQIILANVKRFFTESSVIYAGGFFILWFSHIYFRVHKKQKILAGEVIAASFSVFMLLAYLRTPGWYRYFFAAELLAFMHAPVALLSLYDFLKHKRRIHKAVPIVTLVIIVSCFVGLQLYQLARTSWIAEFYTGTRSHDLQNFFATTYKQGQSVFFYDVPEAVLFLPSAKFYQYISINPSHKFEIGRDQIERIQKGDPDLIVIGTSDVTNPMIPVSVYHTKAVINRYTILEKN